MMPYTESRVQHQGNVVRMLATKGQVQIYDDAARMVPTTVDHFTRTIAMRGVLPSWCQRWARYKTYRRQAAMMRKTND